MARQVVDARGHFNQLNDTMLSETVAALLAQSFLFSLARTSMKKVQSSLLYWPAADLRYAHPTYTPGPATRTKSLRVLGVRLTFDDCLIQWFR